MGGRDTTGEGGTAGIYRPSGEMRTGLVDEIEHARTAPDSASGTRIVSA